MYINIYRSGSVIASIDIDEQTVYTHQLMGEHKINAVFQTTAILPIQIGDYIVWRNENFYINTAPTIAKLASNLFQYTISFEATVYRLYDKLFMDEGAADFSYFGTAADFVQLIVDNMNSIDAGWQLGNIEDTEPQLLNFSNITCRQALNQIADAFKLEYALSGKTIHLIKQIGQSTTLTFEYGKGNALYSLTRKYVQDLNIVTRVYGFGGSRNLGYNYRNGAKRLQFASKYLEKNVTLYGIREGIYVNDNIYPHRDGTVTAINTSDPHIITDAGIDFDINQQLINGVTAQVVFKTGALSGYTFDIVHYDNSSKTITFKSFIDSNGYELPNSLNKPQIGDTYILVGISMPQAYIDAAEAQLQAETQAYLDQNSVPRVAYDLVIDRFYAQDNNLLLNVGDLITVIDADLGINQQIRVSAISYPLMYPENITATIADTVPYTIQEKIIAKTLTNERIIKEVNRTSIELSRLNALRNRELQDLIFDPDGYFDTTHIRPQSIETLMLAVGAKSQNFNLVDVAIIPNYQGDASKLFISAGQLIHNEVQIDGLGNIWSITQQIFSNLAASSAYYVYAKCSKTQLTGTWMISTTPVKVDDIAGYWCFNLGVLYKVSNGVRDFAFTNGMSYIVGDQITAGRIKSLSGQTYFDLNTGEIQGVVKINAGSQGYQNLIDKPDLTPYDNVVNYVNNVLPGKLDDLQNQIDGSITTWFFAYAPTLNNAPAVDWADDATKNKHLGDLFYDTTTGYAYRFMVSNGVYAWQKITDSDVTLALQRASQAQDTADHKRRVFVSQPTPPYDVGDLWSQGASGDILVCTTSRASGSYNVADWTKASKYTDDTTALAAQAAATAAQNAANNAQASADAANAKLADMANDNKLTPGEKQDVLKEWQIIQAEKPNIDAQAGTYSISTTNYDNAYNALSSYLTPLLSNMNVTSNIDGSAFRQKFSDYYTQKILLTKAITDAAKALADNAAAQAQNAQNTANNAQASADAANAKLADMANDNKLTPGEKQDVLKEWQIIQAEKPNINAQAGTYSISTTNYDNAYNALSSYLTPLLSNMSVTSDIDGNTFRQKFSDYYTQKVLLLKAISDKAKIQITNRSMPKPAGALLFHFDESLNSTTGQQPINAIGTIRKIEGKFGGAVASEIGTTNIFNYNLTNYGWVGYNGGIVNTSVTDSTAPTGRLILLQKTGTANQWHGTWGQTLYNFNAGQRVAISGYYKWDGGAATYLIGIILDTSWNEHSSSVRIDLISDGAWHRFDMILTLYDSGSFRPLIYWQVSTYPGSLYLCGIQVEILPAYSNINQGTSFVEGTRGGSNIEYGVTLYSDFTVSFWYAPIMSAYRGNSDRAILGLTNGTNYLNFFQGLLYDFYIGDETNRTKYSLPNQTLNLSTYYHIALVRSGTTIKLYLNGGLWFSTDYGSAPRYNNIKLSCYGNETATPAGLYDEMLILNRAATDEEIKSWAESNAPFFDDTQIAYQSQQLLELSSDNKLTPGEKQDVLKEWQIIQAEKPNIDAQAGTYSISTTNYDNAYNALSSYLTPLLSNMNVTSDIDGSAFRQKFSDYYTQKILLTKAITDAAKALADNAAAQAQNAQNTADNVASKTNFLTTTIDGNVVATGTLLVGDATGNNNAGITGVVDNGSSSIRFWAGDTYANKNSAPFRVLNDGTVYMNKGVLSGWLLDATSLKTSATANNLPVMQIDSSGYIRMSTGASGNAAYLKPTGLLMFAGTGEFITTYGFNTAGFFRINGDTSSIYKDMHTALFAEVVNNGWAAQFNGDVKMLKKLYLNNGIIGNVNTSSSSLIYLSLNDFLVFPFYSSGTAIIYLPYPEVDGQIIYVKPVNNNCTVSRHPSSSHQIIDNNGNLVNGITISRGDMWMFVYAGGYWMAGPMAL